MDVFPWSSLIDDLRPHVLKYLTTTELVAIERVSKTMKSDVVAMLCRVSRLSLPGPGGPQYQYFCNKKEHHFDEEDFVSLPITSQASLIKKLPNLKAICIFAQVGPGVVDALANCSELRHLTMRCGIQINLDKLDWSKMECTSKGVPQLDPAKCPKLQYTAGEVSASNIKGLLKNGLRGVGACRAHGTTKECRKLIFEHGHHLEILNVRLDNLSGAEVKKLNKNLRALQELRLHVSNLPQITIGKTIERLYLDMDGGDTSSLVKLLAERCPNVWSLQLDGVVELVNQQYANVHENVESIRVGVLESNEKNLRKFLKGFPKLQSFDAQVLADDSLPRSKVKNWIKKLNRRFPKVDFDFAIIEGLHAVPQQLNTADKFPWTSLIDDLRLHVLKHLTVTELVAIERVSKTMQSDVVTVLAGVSRLSIPGPEGPQYHNFCNKKEHHFDEEDFVELPISLQASLIKKLPNLKAFCIFAQIGHGVVDALANCSQLRHVAARCGVMVNLDKLDWSKMECTSKEVPKLDPAKCSKMQYTAGEVSDSNIEGLLKNGLRGVSACRAHGVTEECRRLILQHGHQLEIMNVRFDIMSHEEVNTLNANLRGLQELRLHVSNLPEITIGQTLKTLILDMDDGDASSLVNTLTERCPNVTKLQLEGIIELVDLQHANGHEKVSYIRAEILESNEANLREFLKGFPKLEEFDAEVLADYSLPRIEVEKWIKNLKIDFPKVDIEFSEVEGIEDQPEDDSDNEHA